MKHSFYYNISVLFFCLALVACEKDASKDEPNKPVEGSTIPSDPSVEPTDPEPEKIAPTAYFPFDGSLEDVSGNDYYGYGAPMPSFKEGMTSGKMALSFTKTGKEAFVIGDGIIDTYSMTVSFWAKDISEGDIFYLTSSNVECGDKMMSLTFRDGHLKYVFRRYNNYYSNSFNSTGNFNHSPVNDGKWHHIALVSDFYQLNFGSVTTMLYVDGNLMDTVTEEINNFTENELSHRHYETGTKFILGGDNVPMMQIAYLRLYADHQLSDTQLKEIYNNELKGIIDEGDASNRPVSSVNVKSGLAAYFPFDGNLNDMSGNDFHGYGAPDPFFKEGMISGTQSLSFTKSGQQAFVISDGIIDTRTMSICFWAKDISDGNIFHVSSSIEEYGNKMMSLTYTDRHLKYVVRRYNNHYTNSFNSTGNFLHQSIEDGGWHHIALISDYDQRGYGLVTTSLYIDGRIMDTVTEDINPFTEQESNHRHFGVGSKFILGGENVPSMQVAHLRMYDARKLNDAEIMALYKDKN